MEVRTLGQFVETEGILADLGAMLSKIHAHSNHGALKASKLVKLRVSCTTCTATKACCASIVVARLYEGIVIAGHLRKAGRDTPELRAALAAQATQMESTTPRDYRTPCTFLDAAERCTIYNVRPMPCAALNVYTPPALCADRDAEIKAYVAEAEHDMSMQIEEQFRDRLSLRKKIGRRYIGVLPRMVLVALEAWDREDFRDYLRQLDWPSDEDATRWG